MADSSQKSATDPFRVQYGGGGSSQQPNLYQPQQQHQQQQQQQQQGFYSSDLSSGAQGASIGSMGRIGSAQPYGNPPFPLASAAQGMALGGALGGGGGSFAGSSMNVVSHVAAAALQEYVQRQQQGGGGAGGGSDTSGMMIPFPGQSTQAGGGGREFIDSAMQNPLTQVGMQFVQSNVARNVSGALVAVEGLRYHFAVSNAYVRNKLSRLLFPYMTREFRRVNANAVADAAGRLSVPDASGTAYAAPSHDVNAPDLYIPTMAFITFVLSSGIAKMARSSFHPENLVTISSSAVLLQLIEIGALKGAFMGLSADSVPVLDLLSYTSYKYVGLTINTLAGVVLGKNIYYLFLVYTGCSMAYFFINTLLPIVVYETRNLAPGLPAPAISPQAKSQRINVVGIAGIAQIFLMWLLSSI